MSDHLFNIKKNLNELLQDYVKRFKVENAKIVGCNDSIASVAFQKGLSADHHLFRELIMKEDLTLADSFALVEKNALSDEARQWNKESEAAQKKVDKKQSNNEAGRGPSAETGPR
ncbi:hypothetical protein PS1_003873 [Malus domestica]